MAPRRRSAIHQTGGKRPISPPLRPKGGRSRSKSAPRPQSTPASAPPPAPTGSALPEWFAKILDIAHWRAAARGQARRVRFPQASRRELGERLVRSSALRAGLLGAATGTLALIT